MRITRASVCPDLLAQRRGIFRVYLRLIISSNAEDLLLVALDDILMVLPLASSPGPGRSVELVRRLESLGAELIRLRPPPGLERANYNRG